MVFPITLDRFDYHPFRRKHFAESFSPNDYSPKKFRRKALSAEYIRLPKFELFVQHGRNAMYTRLSYLSQHLAAASELLAPIVRSVSLTSFASTSSRRSLRARWLQIVLEPACSPFFWPRRRLRLRRPEKWLTMLAGLLTPNTMVYASNFRLQSLLVKF